VSLISHAESEEECTNASFDDDKEHFLRPKQKRGLLWGARNNVVSTSDDENVVAHVVRAYHRRVLVMKVAELLLCFFIFVASLMPSNYFHLHHAR
jgi:hypothetical protein